MGSGFDYYSGDENIYFLALVKKQTAALSSTTRRAMSQKFDKNSDVCNMQREAKHKLNK